MNKHLQAILDLLQKSESLKPEEKKSLADAVKESDKEITITEFKLERTEKVKRTTAILLEETIAELEQKRKSVEAQNQELEIEASLERVRAQAMNMRKPDDLLDICEVLFHELQTLGFLELRNAMINIYDDDKHSFLNYDYSEKAGRIVTTHSYSGNSVIEAQVKQVRSSNDAFSETIFTGKDLEDWKKFRKEKGEPDDARVDNISALFYYFYSIGTGAIGISSYSSIAEEKQNVLRRFRNVFDFAYRRYTDVAQAEAQARESQIQLALERVRARTMAMQHSEELRDAAALLFKQIADLGTRQWSSGFDIWNANEVSAVAWMSNPDGSLGVPFTVPYTEDNFFKQIYEAKQRGEDLFVMESSGEELEQTYKYLFNLPEAKKHFDGVESLGFQMPKFQITHCAFFSHGYLMFITFEAAPEMWDIFKRFAGVFEQTYTRFLDLQKAEAQARESQIQLALERVRARTMAMQRSDEVTDASHLLERQVAALGIKTWGCAFHIFKENDSLEYHSNADGVMPTFVIPRTYIWQRYYEACQRGETLIIEERVGEACTELYEYMAGMPIVGEELQKMKAAGIPFPTYQVEHAASFKYGYLLFITFEQVPEAHDIFIRFAKVFEQTYTRFLDLQKAEAQTREAQIEAALEKVRASAMAMHNSNDISATTSIVFTELRKIGIQSIRCGVGLLSKDSHMAQVYAAATSSDGEFHTLMRTISMSGHSSLAQQYETWLKQENYQTILSGEDLRSYYDQPFFHSSASYVPPQHYDQNEYGYYFPFSDGLFYVWTEKPYSESELNILNRFKSIIALTFRRYLDLQKAEAQAREAQIQLAMERVRARTMAMQRSDELVEAASLMFQQVQSFGVSSFTCGFNLWQPDDISVKSYMAKPDGTLEATHGVELPHTEHPHFIQSYEARKRGEDFFVMEAGGKELEDTYRYMYSLPDFKKVFKVWKDSGFPVPAFQISHYVFFHQGYLLFITYEPVPEMWDIFKRFGIVFEQTYTRFLDLQKAEAQAKEAKIEAALERVRSRTMAMQRSEELAEVASILFQQVKALGIPQWTCGFNIWEMGDMDYTFYPGNPDGHVLAPVRIPLTEHWVFSKMDESRKRGEEFYMYEKEGEKQVEHYRYMMTLPGLRELLQSMLDAGLQFPTFQIDHFANFSHGNLMFITYEPVPEMHNVFKRFAGVFEQTYTRFLDLQKAEAQARESQIQLALERVRARTMAMQHSNELGQTSALLFQQIQTLGVPPWSCGFNIWEQGDTVFTSYMGSPDGAVLDGIKIPLTEEATFIHFQESRDRGDKLFVDVLEGEALETHYRYFMTVPGIKEAFEKRAQAGSARPTFQINHLASFSHGNLMFITYEPCPEAHDIFVRFAAVFEQTYIRFLDLQKAEAQSKEAQIEAALEKVRSRSLAMHKSEELAFVVDELFLRMKDLEIGFDSVNILEFTEDAFQIWAAYQPGKFTVTKIPFSKSDIPYVRTAVEAKNTGQQLFTHQYLFEEKNLFLKYLFEETHFKNLPDDRKQFLLQCPCYTVSIGFAKNTAIQLQSYSRAAFSEDENVILKRFVNVFEQCYTRFLDLQKAEAQAKEARIENALEKVRSRTMAMQRSDELADVAVALFQQVKELGITAWTAGFNIWQANNAAYIDWITDPAGDFLEPYTIDLTSHPAFSVIREAKQRGDDFFVSFLEGEQIVEVYELLNSFADKGQFQKILDSGMPFPTRQYNHFVFGAQVSLMFITYEPCPEAWDIYKRFGKVFEQTYTRFLDLQKAEAQAREAQIEAALERVRSRTMAMQRSEELLDVASILFQQVKALGVPQWNCGFNIWDIGDKEFTYYPGSPDGKILPTLCKIPLTEHPVFMRFDESRKRGDELLIYEKEGEEQRDHYRYMLSLRGVGDLLQSMLDAGFELPTFQIDHVANFSYGNLIFITYEHFPEMHDVFKRFAKVFEQTYTRFLDLKKAEAQAREAEVEASLERVRASTMAMHQSQQILEVIQVLSEQLLHLGFPLHSTNIATHFNGKDYNMWIYSVGAPMYLDQVLIPSITDFMPELRVAYEQGEEFATTNLSAEDKKRFYDHLFTNTIFKDAAPPERKEFLYATKGYAQSFALQKNTILSILNMDGVPFTGEQNQILKRFSHAFEQSYVRFLDLKKAEAQARESQIEASLERVRSKTMAMHNSQDVGDTVATLFDELKKLGVKTNRCGVLIFGSSDSTEVWTAKSTPSGEVNLIIGHLDVAMHPMLRSARNTWKNKEASFYYEMIGDDLINYYKAINNQPDYPIRVNLDALPSKEIHTEFYFPEGAVFAFTAEPIATDDAQIFKRLAGVFGQTYRRYLDLQKAEAQAREATLEGSLEKVRGKAMAMHNSNDLIATASLVFTELRKLGINSFRSGVGLLTKENRKVKLYSATSSAEGDSLSVVGWPTLDHHPVLKHTYDSWIRNEDYFPVLRGEELKSYYEKIVSTFSVPVAQSEGVEQHGYFLSFSEGLFYGWSEKPYTEAEIKILHRFKAILDLTFRRYMELQKSEANAMEAIRQASLDRVRAEIASMRTTDDLDRITPLIWKELNILNIPFVRCGVFIMDEFQRQIHTFLSTPDGKAIAAFHLPYDTPGNIGEILTHWTNKQMYISHWDEMAFSELGELLVQQGAIPSKQVYMSTVPSGGIHLHCLPFLQGMLYVGNTTELAADDIQLIQSVADAFSTAYARYEDFNKLESANIQIEKTLMDLKQTQAQLVQSEKMASLGELTAGIAHEIQNPLNFVNNFSEVNKELLAEMDEGIDKGNFAEIKNIIRDVISNEEKISHHGKRADAIVKGMLLHSRSSSGVKEPTDLNALTEEYLRLAYHGLRAKDKSFNASLKTDFDETIGRIHIIPQDIGRVILNMINNAFYAVTEKNKQNGHDYQPTVNVSTRKLGDKVLISVKDNGNGIPQKVFDKIFQPFFTTKPTGQGTGLGLSLSYDIIKAHGGELKVGATEGEGAEFIVQLPLKENLK